MRRRRNATKLVWHYGNIRSGMGAERGGLRVRGSGKAQDGSVAVGNIRSGMGAERGGASRGSGVRAEIIERPSTAPRTSVALRFGVAGSSPSVSCVLFPTLVRSE